MKRKGNIWAALGFAVAAMILLTDRYVVPLADVVVIPLACVGIVLFGYGIYRERKKETC